jgi:hypothetical protein
MDIIFYVHKSVELLVQILRLVEVWTRRSMELSLMIYDWLFLGCTAVPPEEFGNIEWRVEIELQGYCIHSEQQLTHLSVNREGEGEGGKRTSGLLHTFRTAADPPVRE